MLKKVTIYIDTDVRYSGDATTWNDRFIDQIIREHIESSVGFGYVQGYTIEDIKKQGE